MNEYDKQIHDIIVALSKLESAFERHEDAMESLTKSQAKIASSMEKLVDMQKDHEVLKVECNARIEKTFSVAKQAHERMDRVDSHISWAVRIVFAVIIVAVLATIGITK